jgi:hypothetical protein
MTLRILGAIAVGVPVTHVDHAVTAERDARVITVGILGQPVGHENVPDIIQRTAFTASACQRRSDLLVFAGLVIGEIDEFVLGELGMQGDIHQPGKLDRKHFRHATNRARVEPATANEAKPAGPLCNENIPIWKKHQAPGVHQALRDYRHLNLMLLGGIEQKRPVSQRDYRYTHGLLDCFSCWTTWAVTATAINASATKPGRDLFATA